MIDLIESLVEVLLIKEEESEKMIEEDKVEDSDKTDKTEDHEESPEIIETMIGKPKKEDSQRIIKVEAEYQE
jgi:hypothetical protein